MDHQLMKMDSQQLELYKRIQEITVTHQNAQVIKTTPC